MKENSNVTTLHSDKPKKGMKGIWILVTVVALLLAGGLIYVLKDKLFNSDIIKVDTPEKSLKSDYRIDSNGLTDFDLVFMQLENNLQNKIYSPLSIKYALYMLDEAAAGNSKAQLDALLGDYKVYTYPNSQNMSFANAIFVKNTFKENILDSYNNTLKNKYNAEIVYDSFASPKKVNDWISKKTLNMLNNFFDDSISNFDFFIVNALAIDMNWNYQLQCEWTEDASNNKVKCKNYYVNYKHENYRDYIPDVQEGNYTQKAFNKGNKVNVTEIGASINKYDILSDLGEDNIRQTVTTAYQKYLSEGGTPSDKPINEFIDSFIEELNSNYKKVDEATDFSFFTNDELKVFAKDLRTYNNKTLQYVAIMPIKTNLASFINDLKASDVKRLIDNLKKIELENFEEGYVTKITGTIPLFEFDYELDLMQDLQKLGIEDIFDNKANLSKMTNIKDEYIDLISHKANIIFSNDGIKASAATAAGGKGATNAGFEYLFDVPVKEIDITFDKPYLFLIRDKDTGEVWFAGTVYNP